MTVFMDMREATDQRRQFLIGRFHRIGYQTLLPEPFTSSSKYLTGFPGDDFAFCLALQLKKLRLGQSLSLNLWPWWIRLLPYPAMPPALKN